MVALPQLAQKHLCPGDELAQEGEEASGPSGVCLGPTDLEESNQKHLAPRTQVWSRDPHSTLCKLSLDPCSNYSESPTAPHGQGKLR